MDAKNLIVPTLIFGLAVSIGCDRTAEPGYAARSYPIKGTVTALDASQSVVMLDHEDIPGLMAAMEMEFKVVDPAMLQDIRAGDSVTGTLEIRDGQQVISRLQKQ